MTAGQVRELAADWLAALINQATSKGSGCLSRSPRRSSR